MKIGKTLVSIFFFVLLVFIFPEFNQAVVDAGFTGTLAPFINLLPLIFLTVAGIIPFVAFIKENEGSG